MDRLVLILYLLEMAHLPAVCEDQVDIALEFSTENTDADHRGVALPEDAVREDPDLCRHDQFLEPLPLKFLLLRVPPLHVVVDELVDDPALKYADMRHRGVSQGIDRVRQDRGVEGEDSAVKGVFDRPCLDDVVAGDRSDGGPHHLDLVTLQFL